MYIKAIQCNETPWASSPMGYWSMVIGKYFNRKENLYLFVDFSVMYHVVLENSIEQSDVLLLLVIESLATDFVDIYLNLIVFNNAFKWLVHPCG